MEDPNQLVQDGMQRHRAGATDEADRLYQRALELSPQHPDALHLLGVLRLQHGDFAAAADLIGQAIRANPGAAHYYVNHGLTRSAAGDLGLAIEDFVSAWQLHPCHPSAFAALRVALAELGRLQSWAEAEKSLHDWTGPVAEAIENFSGKSLKDVAPWNAASRALAKARLTLPELMCAAAIWAILGREVLDRLDALPALLDAEQVLPHLFDASVPASQRLELIPALALDIRSDRAWNELVFREFGIPALTQALNRDDFYAAAFLESSIAFSFMQQPHSERQSVLCADQMRPLFADAANRLRRDPPAAAGNAGDTRTVAFVHDVVVNASSPNLSLLRIIAGLVQLESPPFRAVVAGLSGFDESMRRRYAAIGVETIDLDEVRGTTLQEDDMLARIDAMAVELAAHGALAAVYLNTMSGLTSLMAARRQAPVQIYWSMGFRNFRSPDIDGYLIFGGPVKSRQNVGGLTWLTGPCAIVDPYRVVPFDASHLAPSAHSSVNTDLRRKFGGHLLRQNDGAQAQDPETVLATAATIRCELGVESGAVLIGTICRAQKIDNDEFLGTVARILLGNPRALYLWFGADELPGVRSRMRDLGISDRCLFRGYVAVEVYSKVLDIHLDSFPFPTGLTMCDTMSAGTALVWMEGQIAREVGVASLVLPLMEGMAGTPEERVRAKSIYTDPVSGETLIPLARDVEHYIQLCSRMIADPDYRLKVGHAGRNFVREFMHDIRVPALIFASHILDIIKARTANQ